MKNILRKSLYIILMVTMIITSFTPYSTKADTTQVKFAGGTEQTDDGKVIISKNITKNDKENYFDIELSVKTKKRVSEIKIPQDLAIVLLIDNSGSMGKCVGGDNGVIDGNTCKNGKSRISALKEALTDNGFIDQFYDEANKAAAEFPNVKRQIGVVTFSNGSAVVSDLKNYKDITKSSLEKKINDISSDGGTNLAAGLKTAGDMIKNITYNKYIIVLTDGYPSFYDSPTGQKPGCNGNDTWWDDRYSGYTYTRGYKKCGIGSTYDNDAAVAANEAAKTNAANGIKTYTIGVGLETQEAIEDYSNTNNEKYYIAGYELVGGNKVTTYDYSKSLTNLAGKDIVITNGNNNTANALASEGNDGIKNITLSDKKDDSSVWRLVAANNGGYYLYNVKTNKYLKSVNNSNDFRLYPNKSDATVFNISSRYSGGYRISYTTGNYYQTTYYLTYNNGWKVQTSNDVRVYLGQIGETTAEIKRHTGVEQFKQWLGGAPRYGSEDKTGTGIAANITRGEAYSDVTNTEQMKKVYEDIFAGIRKDMEELSQAWTVRDPMNFDEEETVTGFKVGEFAQFVNFYETSKTGTGARVVDANGNPIYEINNVLNSGKVDNQVEFDPETNRILWDLKNSDYVLEEYNSKTKETTYTYRLTYRVRLMNENGDSDHLFDGNTTYSTNGDAELDYVFVENGEIVDRGTLDFPNPIVVGRSNAYSFNKLSGYSNINLDGALFRVYLNTNGENTKKMFAEAAHIREDFEMTASAISGHVDFYNIPSGYDYFMEEVKAPQGYVESMVGPFGPINDLESAQGYGYKESIYNNENDGSKIYSFTIVNGVITKTDAPDTIYNFPEYKKLVIRKEVKPNDENNKNAYIDNNKEFTFNIKVDDKVAKYYEASKNGQSIKINLNKQTGTFKLKNNEEIEIYIPYGVHYEIEESEHTGYTVTYDGNEVGNITLTNKKIVVTNKKEPTNIKVKKEWKNIQDYAEIPKVEVTLQKSVDGNAWDNVNKIELNSTNQFYYEWKNLDGDYAYKVVETNVIGEDPNVFEVNYKFDENTGTWTITNTDTRIMVLPETGSSGALILASLALVLMTMPVMYTAYNLYIDKRWF